MTASTSTPLAPPRQIRALYDDSTITLYQAYSSTIASLAVEHQRLSASPAFKSTRMTWIKPSWCWMMYRSGYSRKDPGQERILALRMKHAHFRSLLAKASPVEPSALDPPKPRPDTRVRIQWDPERGPRLERLPYRSIQIGIPPALVKVWVEEWIEGIEDVTEKARRLKDVLDGDGDVGEEELVGMGLLPVEREYEVEGELARRLGMGSYGEDPDGPLSYVKFLQSITDIPKRREKSGM